MKPDDIPQEAWDAAGGPSYPYGYRPAIARAIFAAEQRGAERERERIVSLITEQAGAMAEMAVHGLPENSRYREAMEAALTRIAHAIRNSTALSHEEPTP